MRVYVHIKFRAIFETWHEHHAILSACILIPISNTNMTIVLTYPKGLEMVW